MRRVAPLFVAALALGLGAAACGSASTEPVGATEDALWTRQARWAPSADGIVRISVCWETPGFAAEKDVVRRAVADSWSAVAPIQFLGWGDCGNGDLRIRIADERPHATSFGTKLQGVPGGVTLNFAYQAWGVACASSRTTCNRSYAMHEFGHALGFLHEHDRPDAPPACPDGTDKRTNTSTNNTMYLGTYDPDSIMNCCAPTVFTTPGLSAGDVVGAQAYYGQGGAPKPGTEGYQGLVRGLAGKCLDDAAASTDNGTKIQLWSCHDETAQRWTYANGELRGPGGKCVDVPNSDDSDGTPVWLYDCNGTAAQRWTWSPEGTIRGLSGKCLDVRESGTDDGTQVQLWPCNGTVAQIWSPSW